MTTDVQRFVADLLFQTQRDNSLQAGGSKPLYPLAMCQARVGLLASALLDTQAGVYPSWDHAHAAAASLAAMALRVGLQGDASIMVPERTEHGGMVRRAPDLIQFLALIGLSGPEPLKPWRTLSDQAHMTIISNTIRFIDELTKGAPASASLIAIAPQLRLVLEDLQGPMPTGMKHPFPHPAPAIPCDHVFSTLDPNALTCVRCGVVMPTGNRAPFGQPPAQDGHMEAASRIVAGEDGLEDASEEVYNQANRYAGELLQYSLNAEVSDTTRDLGVQILTGVILNLFAAGCSPGEVVGLLQGVPRPQGRWISNDGKQSPSPAAEPEQDFTATHAGLVWSEHPEAECRHCGASGRKVRTDPCRPAVAIGAAEKRPGREPDTFDVFVWNGVAWQQQVGGVGETFADNAMRHLQTTGTETIVTALHEAVRIYRLALEKISDLCGAVDDETDPTAGTIAEIEAIADKALTENVLELAK